MTAFLSFFLCFLCSLLAIAFYTLFERKFLGHAQLRKGPNKVRIIGLPQPFSDAIKLFLKQSSAPLYSNSKFFFLAPVMGLILALIIWILYPFIYSPFFFLYRALLFILISSLRVYTVVVAGWCSNSKYALLGTMRRIAQTISYEISIALFLLSVVVFIGTFRFFGFLASYKIWLLILFPPLFFVWVVTVLAETNRAPFDFAEGESELVSGFNVEYSAGSFAFIFIAEYANILAMRVLTASIFIGSFIGGVFSPFINIWVAIFIAILVVWARAALPRIRYDCLIILTWKSFLPFSFGLLLLVYSIIGVLG